MRPLRKLLPIIGLFACTTIINAQVGIGTTSPSAELEIVGTDDNDGTDIPTLALNTQRNPQGTATGQLAVIGDLLYMYDATRSKWLSVESTALQFGRDGNINSQTLYFGGNLESGSSGPLMPYDGTVVGITANSSGGTSTKQFQVRVRNGTTTQTTISFNLSSNTYTDSTTNNNFSTGDYINVRAINNGDGTVSDPGIVVWVKWRVDN